MPIKVTSGTAKTLSRPACFAKKLSGTRPCIQAPMPTPTMMYNQILLNCPYKIGMHFEKIDGALGSLKTLFLTDELAKLGNRLVCNEVINTNTLFPAA